MRISAEDLRSAMAACDEGVGAKGAEAATLLRWKDVGWYMSNPSK